MTPETLAERVLAGGAISKEEALWLWEQPLEPISTQAERIREHFCGNSFSLCAIVSGKQGLCGEDCRFCAQSVHSATGAATHPLLPEETLLEAARRAWERGVPRFSIVTAGRLAIRYEI